MATMDEDQSERLDGRTIEVEAGDQWQLLPGIPDEITTDKIGPKLPWTAFHSLSRVNRGWRRQIQDHEVYKARLRAQSTETLIVLDLIHKQPDNYSNVFALYSMNDKSCYLLPPIPGTGPQFGIQWSGGQCISLHGKVFLLGGFRHSLVEDHPTTSDVYVMDLAGQGQIWKQCASMQDPRQWFGCGVMNGKIYVFGGLSDMWPVCGSEVYDPTKDVWSPIAQMMSFRCNQKVTTSGEELFVHSGNCIHSKNIYGSDDLKWERNEEVDLRVSLGKGNQIQNGDAHRATFAEVYWPLKDEWRIVKNFTKVPPIQDPTEILMVEGKLYRISVLDIDLHDSHSNSWIPLQSLSVDLPIPTDILSKNVIIYNSILVEDRIISQVNLVIRTVASRGDVDSNHSCHRIMRSDRLGGENKELVFRELKIKSSLPPGLVLRSLLCSIQL